MPIRKGICPRPHESLEVRRADVTPRYFETLGIPMIEGREFTQDDSEKAPRVLIVDETAARRYWPGQDPLGKKLSIWGHPFLVVGVVKNSKHQFMNERPGAHGLHELLPGIGQRDDRTGENQRQPGGYRLRRWSGRSTKSTDRLPVFDVRSMRETTQMARIFAVMQSTFAGMFAVIALVLAATGIYGVVAYRTQLRTHEIGVRIALGASRTNVLRLVLLQGLWLTLIGLVFGLALSFGLTRFIAGLLYGISANDPMTVVGVVVLLGAMSLLACYLPAHRAMHVNPVAAIREQ